MLHRPLQHWRCRITPKSTIKTQGTRLSAIHDLIAQTGDARLRERLAAEWAHAAQEKKLGLVFEDHLPELLPLYDAKPRRGDLVCLLDAGLIEMTVPDKPRSRLPRHRLTPAGRKRLKNRKPAAGSKASP